MVCWYSGQKHNLLPGEKQGGEAFPCVEELSSRPGVNTTLLSSGNCYRYHNTTAPENITKTGMSSQLRIATQVNQDSRFPASGSARYSRDTRQNHESPRVSSPRRIPLSRSTFPHQWSCPELKLVWLEWSPTLTSVKAPSR